MKAVESLRLADLTTHAVWEFAKDSSANIRPVTELPIKNLDGKIVATELQLANGSSVWGLIGNIDISKPHHTEHFLTLSILRGKKWFMLARYHDFDYSDRGPDALAQFLGLPINEVFPISYDVSCYFRESSTSLSGTVDSEPREKLSRSKLISMAVA